MSQIDWKQLGVLQMQDRIHQLSYILCNNGSLDELPHPDNNASVQSFDGPAQLPDHVTTPTITSVQHHSNSATSLHQDQPCTTIQSTTPNAISSNGMPKRTAENAGLSSSSFDDPVKESSSQQSQDVGSSRRPEHETADGSEDAAGNRNKRTKTAGSSKSSSKEQPKHPNIAGSSQQAIVQNHGADSTQQHQPINSHATVMQVDEGPTQSASGAMASAGSKTLSDWANLRVELEGLPQFHERYSSDQPGTSSSHEQPSQKTSTVAHRSKSQRSSEKHSEQAARASRPHDPFSSNHKDHAKKGAKRPDSNLEPILDSDSDNDEAQPSKGKDFPDFLAPYDDDWHISTLQDQAAELASIHESTIKHEGQTLTYIKIPWAGRPGWIESYVDETALEYLSDVVGYHGRRGRPTLAQLKENQRKRLEEEPVDVLVGDDETCDSIIMEMVKREECKRKGKGKGKGK